MLPVLRAGGTSDLVAPAALRLSGSITAIAKSYDTFHPPFRFLTNSSLYKRKRSEKGRLVDRLPEQPPPPPLKPAVGWPRERIKGFISRRKPEREAARLWQRRAVEEASPHACCSDRPGGTRYKERLPPETRLPCKAARPNQGRG